jgi:hypothetical protein
MTPLNFSNFTFSGLAGAGAGAVVAAGFAGAGAGAGFCCAMAPKTNATNVSKATEIITFFILVHLLSS